MGLGEGEGWRGGEGREYMNQNSEIKLQQKVIELSHWETKEGATEFFDVLQSLSSFSLLYKIKLLFPSLRLWLPSRDKVLSEVREVIIFSSGVVLFSSTEKSVSKLATERY